jgi:hypothetical protein
VANSFECRNADLPGNVCNVLPAARGRSMNRD